MKRLTLIRHANAEWKDASIPDFDRPLNKRGFGEAEGLGRLLLEKELVPDLLIASAARRTQQTADILARVLRLTRRRVKSSEALYLAPYEDILRVVRDTGPRVQHLAVVCHNPGISDLSRYLAPPDTQIADLSTGAACTLTFTVRSWERLGPTAARAVTLEPPSRLLHLFS